MAYKPVVSKGEPKEVTETSIYGDYTIVFKRAIESELVTPETPDAPATYKDVYVVGLAQKNLSRKTDRTATTAFEVDHSRLMQGGILMRNTRGEIC